MKIVIKILKFLASVIAIPVSLYLIWIVDEYLTSIMIERYIKSLNEPEIINKAIRAYYSPAYSDLSSLRTNYPEFTPKISHWSDYGSAILEFTHIGWGIGKFAIELPDGLIVVDADGNIRASRNCGSDEGECEVVEPKVPELGITGKLYYKVNQSGENDLPVKSYKIFWSKADESRIVTNENCFWAYTPHATQNRLTIIPSEKDALNSGSTYKYGFYRVTNTFNIEGVKRGYVKSTSGEITRITKEEFFKSSKCE